MKLTREWLRSIVEDELEAIIAQRDEMSDQFPMAPWEKALREPAKRPKKIKGDVLVTSKATCESK